VRGEILINQISTLLHSPLKISEILQIALERVVQAVKGSGGRLFVSSSSGESDIEIYTYGSQPVLTESHPTVLEHYPFWQQLMTCEKSIDQPSNVTDYWRDLILSEQETMGLRRSGDFSTLRPQRYLSRTAITGSCTCVSTHPHP
jgi:hypothetical protein